MAAREAESVITRLLHERLMFISRNDATKNGECRMKNCVKYDLGHGYRMITIRDRDILHISFVGTHDECDRWLEKQRRFQSVFLKSRSTTIPVEMDGTDSSDSSGFEKKPLLEYEEESFQPIEEKYLRMVFSGLVGKHPESTGIEKSIGPG